MKINLSNNNISHLPGDSFSNLAKIEAIIIYSNPLKTINKEIYRKIGGDKLIFEWKITLFEEEQ